MKHASPVTAWIVVGVLAVVLLAICGLLVWRASRSPLKPQRIPFEAWGSFPLLMWGLPWTVVAIVLVIASGAVLQLALRHFAIHGAYLPLMGVIWQAVMATVTAGLAMGLLRLAFENVWGGVYDAEVQRSNLRQFLLGAAFGFAIWLLGYVIGFVGRVAFVFSPAALRWLAPPLAGALSFALLTPLQLIRPMLAIGRRGVVADARLIARRHTLALYVMAALLLIPPTVLVPAFLTLPRIMLEPGLNSRPISIGLVTLFTAAQFLAVEIAVLIFAKRAVLFETTGFCNVQHGVVGAREVVTRAGA